jgi:hypothetical protein
MHMSCDNLIPVMAAAYRWCLIRHSYAPKHVWTCSNLPLHALQTKRTVRSQPAEEMMCVRDILLAQQRVTRI